MHNIVVPHRYEITLKCWEDEADKRPTFTEIVSRYHDGLIPGTSKAEQGGGYVLLGSEEKCVAKHQKKLSETSVMNISMINKDSKMSTPSAGMTFDVTFLSPRGEGEQDPECDIAAAMLDQECYMEMNSVSNCHAGVSVLVNQAALHEYDNVVQDHQEEMGAGGERDGHVTTDPDHVTAGSTHSLNQKLNTSTSDYILMGAANNNIITNVSRARHTRH